MASTQDLIEQSKHNVAIENEELNLVRLFGLRPYPDGDKWCWLLGEDLQNGVAGFGDTPLLAAYDFNKNFRSNNLPKLNPKPELVNYECGGCGNKWIEATYTANCPKCNPSLSKVQETPSAKRSREICGND